VAGQHTRKHARPFVAGRDADPRLS